MRKLAFSISTVSCLFLAGLLSAQSKPDGEKISHIRLDSNAEVTDERILKVLPLKAGDPLDLKKISLAEEMIESLLKNSGYLEAAIRSSVERPAAGAEVAFHIHEGPLYRFGKTHVTGLTTLPRKVIDLELTYEEGDPYNRQELFETQSRLYLTGRLDEIRIQASTTSSRSVDIAIDLKQQSTKWIKGGVGWGSEEKERLTLTFTHENLWREAHKLEVLGTVSRIWEEYKTDYVIPYFFDTRTEQKTSLSWREEDREGYDFERVLGVWSLGRDLTLDIKGTLAYQLKRTVTFNVDPEIAPTTPERSDGRSLSLAFNRDKANDPFYPTRGTRSNLLLERSGGFLGGTLNFNRVSLDAHGYHPIWKSLIAAVALRSGFIQEFPPSEEVPIFERYFIGGANSVRGYNERDVGPKDSEGSPLGGEWKLGSTFEVRFPIVWRLTGALFLDGGQVGDQAADVGVSKWKYGGGGGLRVQTPVGPIRLDYGYKLNRDANDTDPWRFHFSLGESF